MPRAPSSIRRTISPWVGAFPPPSEARFKDRAKQTKAALDRLRAIDAGRAKALMTQFATAVGHAQAKRFDQGLAILQEIPPRARLRNACRNDWETVVL